MHTHSLSLTHTHKVLVCTHLCILCMHACTNLNLISSAYISMYSMHACMHALTLRTPIPVSYFSSLPAQAGKTAPIIGIICMYVYTYLCAHVCIYLCIYMVDSHLSWVCGCGCHVCAYVCMFSLRLLTA